MTTRLLVFVGAMLTSTVLSFFSLGVVLATLLLAGCGGGGSNLAGGVGSGGSGLAEGTVSGFGSVIVDGVAYGDAQALVERDGESGVAEAKLGQRVRITHEQGQASGILVLPQLIGAAATGANAQGEFLLLGQRVRIVADGSGGLAPTVLDGLSQVRAGDALEVHGLWSREAGQSLLLASRIEKLSALPQTLLVSAPVRSREGERLVLDDARGTEVRTTGMPSSVQAAGLVRLRLDSSALSSASWVAQSAADASPPAAAGQVFNLSATVSAADASAGRVRVQGLDVRLPDDRLSTPPTPGTPVQMQIQRQGGQWVATRLTEQSSDSLPAVQLKGSLDWSPGASQLQVRGTTVSLPAGALSDGCRGLGADTEVFVTVQARPAAPGQLPVATRVDCATVVPEGGVQEATGVLRAVQARSVQVSVRGSLLSLDRNERSLMPADPAALLERSVEIEYQRIGGSLVLRKLKPR